MFDAGRLASFLPAEKRQDEQSVLAAVRLLKTEKLRGMLFTVETESIFNREEESAKTMEAVLTGKAISAEEAAACGLISRVVNLSDLENEALKTAMRISSLPYQAVIQAKETIAQVEPGQVEFKDHVRIVFYQLFYLSEVLDGGQIVASEVIGSPTVVQIDVLLKGLHVFKTTGSPFVIIVALLKVAQRSIYLSQSIINRYLFQCDHSQRIAKQ